MGDIALEWDYGCMSDSHFLRNSLLIVGGLVVAGWLAIEVFALLANVFWYLVVGAIVVGGGMYLYGRAKRSLQSGRVQRKITRRY
jgi:hypothetical protein